MHHQMAVTVATVSLLLPLSVAAQSGDRPKPSQASVILSALDKDGDDKISPSEAPEQLKQNFAIVDRDSDGGIDLVELKAILAFAAGQREPDRSGAVQGATTETDLTTRGPSFGTVNTKQVMRMRSLSSDEDRPFYMLNLIKYRERAVYRDGRETNLTGRQANNLYSPFEFLSEIGAEIAYVGEVNAQQEGSSPKWETVAIVKYPSRAKFFEMTGNKDFQARAMHKDAGIEVTQVVVTERVPWTAPANAARARADDEEKPVTLLQLVKYRDVADYPAGSTEGKRSGREAMELYEDAVAGILSDVGAERIMKLDVEGVFIGDGREWSECRLIQYPNQRAFREFEENAQVQKVQHHRTAAIEDSYNLQLRTQID